MEKDELAGYFDGTKSLVVFYSKIFIDYDDIETPIQAVFKGSMPINLSSNMKTDARYTLGTNEFKDMPYFLQLFSEEVTSKFLNLESVE